MKTMTRVIPTILMTCVLGAVVAFSSLLLQTPTEPDAMASPSVSVAVVDAAGNVVPGAIPPRVVIDLSNAVVDASEWRLLKVFNGTDFLANLVTASGYVDAGFASTAGLVYTLDVPAGLGNSGSVETEEVLIKVVSPLLFGAPDAGASTVVLDVGISGTLQKYARDVNLLAAANTRVRGSNTLIYRQPIVAAGTSDGGIVINVRNVDTSPLAYRFIITQSAKNLTTVNGGQFRIFVKNAPIFEY